MKSIIFGIALLFSLWFIVQFYLTLICGFVPKNSSVTAITYSFVYTGMVLTVLWTIYHYLCQKEK